MMSRFVAALLLALGMISRFAPKAVTCARAGDHWASDAFAQHAGPRLLLPEEKQDSLRVRGLEKEDFKVDEVPDTRKSTNPIILKLYPPIQRPELLHANLPLRFGRSSPRGAAWMFQIPPNLTRRLGRSTGTDSPVTLPCHQCARDGGVATPSATLPQRFGRTSHFYSSPVKLV